MQSDPMPPNRVATIAAGIMCKPPRPGLTKTRLGAVVGAQAAARLSAAFLADVASEIERQHDAGVQGWGLYMPADAEPEVRALLPMSFQFAPQLGADFSSVVHRAIADLLERHPCGAMLVNSDSPTLPGAVIGEAARHLRAPGDKLVIGPARDGGYYLIGLNRAHWPLFDGIPWSTSTVQRDTVARAAALGLPVVRLPKWYDVDDAESLGWLRAELAKYPEVSAPGLRPGSARRTRAALSDLGLLGSS